MGDDAAFQPGIHERAEADLDDVAPEQQDHPAVIPLCLYHGIHHSAEVLCGEDIGEATEKGGKGAVRPGGRREQGGIHFVPPLGHRDGADSAEICLPIAHAQRLMAEAEAPGRTMSLSRRVMVPKGNLVRICTGSLRASSVSQMRVSERLETRPLVSITG